MVDNGKLKDIAVGFNLDLYKSDPNTGGTFITGCFPRIIDASLLELNATYTDGEIYTTIMNMNPLKATSSHGLKALFYQKA